MPERLELYLLGPLRILCNGELITNELPVKAQALLCYLAVTGETYSRQALAGLLWSNVPEAKALGSLRVLLNALRKRLPQHLTITHLTVALNPNADCWSDVGAFTAQWQAIPLPGATPHWAVTVPVTNTVTDSVADTNLASLHAALELYRGDFLHGLFVEEAVAWEEWVLGQRISWQQQALQGLSTLAEQLLARRDYRAVVAVLTRRLALEPWAEEAHRQLMLTHSRLRDFNAALAQYATCRKILADELGIEPMPETVALASRIQAARRMAPAALPVDPTPLVGRQALLLQVHQLLANPTCRLVTLIGLGGMGKTRLALEVAHQINREQALTFLHGVSFVSFEGVTHEGALAQTLATALNLPAPGGVEPSNAVLHYLQDKEQLLVLDNVEPSLAGNTLLLQIIGRCPDVTLLATSRAALNLSIEWPVALEGLAYPPPLATASETRLAAVQLFVEAAKQSQPSFQLTAENMADVFQLCQLVGGMPLAIKLAASWVRVLSCAEIVAALTENLDALSTAQQDIPRRQRSLRAIFDATWAQLTAAEVQILAGLAHFRGGFTAEGARAVTGATPAQLRRLVDRGLIQRWPQQAAVRYRMHGLVRHYAAAQVTAADQQRLARAHAAFYMALAEANEGEAATVAGTAWPTQLANEQENFRAAIEWLLQRAHATDDRTEIGLRLIAALWSTWYWRTAWQESSVWLQQLLAAPTATVATVGRAKALRCAAVMAHVEGKLANARALFEESATLCRAIGNQRSLAYTLIGLSVTLRDMGDGAGAHQGLAESQRFFAATGDRWGAALGNNELGRIAMSQGDYAAAQHYFSASLAQTRELHDDWGVIYLRHNLLALALCQRDNIAAQRCYAEILAIHRTLPPHGPQMHVLQAMTLSAYILGDVVAWSAHFVDDYTTAVALFEEQLVISRERGDEQLTARLLNHLGDVMRATGDHTYARALYQQSLALFQRLDLPAGVALVFHNLGHIHLQQGNLVEAAAKFITSLRIFLESKIVWNQADCLVGLAGVAAAQGELPRAAQFLGAAHTLHHTVDVSGAYASPAIRRTGEQIQAAVQQALSAPAWRAAWAAGAALVREDSHAWMATLIAGQEKTMKAVTGVSNGNGDQ